VFNMMIAARMTSRPCIDALPRSTHADLGRWLHRIR
jgi:hypothetical protein